MSFKKKSNIKTWCWIQSNKDTWSCRQTYRWSGYQFGRTLHTPSWTPPPHCLFGSKSLFNSRNDLILNFIVSIHSNWSKEFLKIKFASWKKKYPMIFPVQCAEPKIQETQYNRCGIIRIPNPRLHQVPFSNVLSFPLPGNYMVAKVSRWTLNYNQSVLCSSTFSFW